MTAVLQLAARYWREVALAALLLCIGFMWHVIQNRDGTINGLNTEIAQINATNTTNNKWTQATTDVLQNVIKTQNEGIQSLKDVLQQSNADIKRDFDAKRQADAKQSAELKTYITKLPKATDCSGMMQNLINFGQQVK